MGRINVLDQKTANTIKAGEVIDRPVSVVKELIDNSIDAGSTIIKVEFEGGGIAGIRVSDNGIGMDADDARKCFLLHATSKIKAIEDIYDLSTQGFRGEALASIAACAEVTLITKQEDAAVGTMIRYVDGKFHSESEVAADRGTVVSVKNLFANIPARYKFLKKDSTEGMYICTLVEKLAVINPHISFRLFKDGKSILTTPGSGEMLDAIYSIYGKSIASGLIPVKYEYEGLKLRGFTGNTDTVRGNRSMQYIYVNDRCIRNSSVSAAIDEAYRNSVMKNRFPICFLSIYVPAGEVDVNVHPQKAEVKFSNESDVFRLVFHGIKEALSSGDDSEDDVSNSNGTAKGQGGSSYEGMSHSLKSVVPSSAGRQLFYDLTPDTDAGIGAGSEGNSARSSVREAAPTSQETKAALDLMSILSEFKPDIASIAGDDEDDTRYPSVEAGPAIDDGSVVEETDIQALLHARFVGFLFRTYIILEGKDSYFLVDQHAAHERVLYEKFMLRRQDNDYSSGDVQTLLVPQILELSSADYSFVADNAQKFLEAGFDLEILGERQVAIRSVPVADSHSARLKKMEKPTVIFEQILTDLKRETPKKSDVWYSLIQTTACKAAIKAHDVITETEAMELIKQLSVLKDPYHCAHGRPTFKRIYEEDLRKDFKRIL